MVNADQHVKRRHESPELGRSSMRMMRALAGRAGEGDMEALEALDQLTSDLNYYTARAVDGLRAKGYSWADVASCLGVSRQAAQQRFRVRS